MYECYVRNALAQNLEKFEIGERFGHSFRNLILSFINITDRESNLSDWTREFQIGKDFQKRSMFSSFW